MLIIDAHVHIYDCFNMELFFDSAFANFRKQAVLLQCEHDFCGVLLLAEKTEQNVFCSLAESLKHTKENKAGRWKIFETDEPFTLKLATPSGETLFLVQGRQLNSSEGLEVLSLVSDKEVRENLPLDVIVKEIIHKQGIPVIPWAFGKWFGKRGDVLKSFISRGSKRPFFLGDNGGRPSLYFPGILSQHKKNKCFKMVSGSDPLPLKNEEHRVGSFGVYVETRPDITGIGRQIYKLTQDPDCRFISYGNALGLKGFLRNQFLLRKKTQVSNL